jgi:hypothetical protein
MYLHLHDLTIRLDSDEPAIAAEWGTLFEGWLVAESEGAPAVTLCLQAVAELPPLPPAAGLVFSNTADLGQAFGGLSVYRGEDGRLALHFADGALVYLPLLKKQLDSGVVVEGWITARLACHHGRVEDITYTSLAPLLRRRGYYLIHASAVARQGKTVLLVGPSGSGKTTAALSLLAAGWDLLANDVVLCQERPDGIYALPTPGGTSVRPETVGLLPSLATLAARHPVHPLNGKHNFSTHELVNGRWGAAAMVAAVLFPRVRQSDGSYLYKENRAVCLARLIAESADRWDEGALLAHFTFLQRLSQQAEGYALHSGRDVGELAEIVPLFEQSQLMLKGS